MKTKQLVAFVVAAAVFLVTGVLSVLVNTWSDYMQEEKVSWYDVLMEESAEQTPLSDYVAVVEVEGSIAGEPETSIWGEAEGYDHPRTMEYINQLMEDEANKGILLYVNTPGGEVTASDDMYLKLMEYKERTGRKIYCYFADQACSGGYYISMAADEIYANRNCWTGSIGVIISLTNLKGLYEKLGIEEINITSGVNKAMGSSGEELTAEQSNILQGLVDEAYEQFVSIVAEGRGLSIANVKKLADGRIYTAKQALENQLIDGICTKEEYYDRVLEELGEDVILYEREKGSVGLGSLFGALEELRPKSDAEVLGEMMEKGGMGGIMYYAEFAK